MGKVGLCVEREMLVGVVFRVKGVVGSLPGPTLTSSSLMSLWAKIG